jgi:ABC-type uncharacterized transport system auxiliary subunit
MRARTIVAATVAAVMLAACGGAVSDEHERTEPYTLKPVNDHVSSVTLTEVAAERIDIQTAEVTSEGDSLVVPSDAVFIDAHGGFWVYTNPNPLEFVREQITVVREEGGLAILSDGPPVGTVVVTVGVPELYGAETEFGT